MSNGVTEESDFFNHTSSTTITTTVNVKAMTLENHHNHTDGDAVVVAQATQGEDTCNNMQMEQRESTTVEMPCSPCSPPGSDDNISASLIGTMPDSTISTVVNTNNIITLMQSSPPPHSYRHSRAYRHFKNPPQPHMCIRTTTEAGEELFINVLSWTRIVIPQEPSDPIPLYGGMRVPPGSPRSPPIVFAVMANPEVLKDSGRHSKDPEERRAMVELMCDFVEAMNPGVKLIRNAVILKDRDISGELKDVWNAVQAQRDREREEQMLQQRQQQHYHNITTQQMFPKSGENDAPTTITAGTMNQQYQYETQQEQYIDNGIVQMTTENEMPMSTTTNFETQYVDNGAESNIVADNIPSSTETTNIEHCVNDTLSNESNNRVITLEDEETSNNACNFNGNNDCGDQTDAGNKADKNIEIFADNKPTISSSANNNNNSKNTNATSTTATSPRSTNAQLDVVASATIAPVANTTTTTTATAAVSVATVTNASNNTTASVTTTVTLNATPKIVATATSTPTPIATPPTKKDKLGGFLPNGCIFPRFKNSKNKDKDKEKDKDKDKDKESKGKDKTLLNALKKSKEKKVAPSEQLEKTTSATTASDPVEAKSQYEKNFISLETEVQRLDLNKIDATSGSDNSVFIKLKMSTSSATAK